MIRVCLRISYPKTAIVTATDVSESTKHCIRVTCREDVPEQLANNYACHDRKFHPFRDDQQIGTFPDLD